MNQTILKIVNKSLALLIWSYHPCLLTFNESDLVSRTLPTKSIPPTIGGFKPGYLNKIFSKPYKNKDDNIHTLIQNCLNTVGMLFWDILIYWGLLLQRWLTYNIVPCCPKNHYSNQINRIIASCKNWLSKHALNGMSVNDYRVVMLSKSHLTVTEIIKPSLKLILTCYPLQAHGLTSGLDQP